MNRFESKLLYKQEEEEEEEEERKTPATTLRGLAVIAVVRAKMARTGVVVAGFGLTHRSNSLFNRKKN